MKTIQTSIDILKLLGEKALSVKMISETLNLNKSTTSRILTTLKKERFVKLNNEKKYELGYGIFEFANKMSSKLSLQQVVKPYLEYLNKLTNETVHLGILDGSEIVYIDKIECSHPIRMYSSIGKRVASYCTGLGKAIIAFLPKAEKDKIIENIKFEKFTGNTITDKKNLKNELEKVKERGIAYDNGEHEENIFCISAPIFDFYKNVVASISISATKQYKDLEALKAFEENLKQTCKEISEKLGF